MVMSTDAASIRSLFAYRANNTKNPATEQLAGAAAKFKSNFPDFKPGRQAGVSTVTISAAAQSLNAQSGNTTTAATGTKTADSSGGNAAIASYNANTAAGNALSSSVQASSGASSSTIRDDPAPAEPPPKLLRQAGISMLSQSNAPAQQALSLLS